MGGRLQPVLMRHTPQLSVKTRGGGGGGGPAGGRGGGGGGGVGVPDGGRGGSGRGSGGRPARGEGGGELRLGASDSAEILVDDTYGCEVQSHKV